MKTFDDYLMGFLDSPVNVVAAALALLLLVALGLNAGRLLFYVRFIAKSLRRNVLRSSLTALATMAFVFMVTMVWSILHFLDMVTSEKSKDLKAIVTEKWQVPSQMPFAYASALAKGGAATDDDVKVQDSMTWQFHIGTIDPGKMTRESIIFFFCMQPSKLITISGLPPAEQTQFDDLRVERRKLSLAAKRAPKEQQPQRNAAFRAWTASPNKGGALRRLEAKKAQTEQDLKKRTDPVVESVLRGQPIDFTEVGRLADQIAKDCTYISMMDDIDQYAPREQCALYVACLVMEKDRRKALVGQERLKAMNKRVGDRITAYGLPPMHKDLDLEVEVLGTFPDGRYNQSALLNCEYLNESLAQYKYRNKGAHPLDEKSLGLVWLRVPDNNAFREVAEDLNASPLFKNPAIKCETASSGIAAWLEAYRSLLWGLRYLFVPAILVTMSLVIANAISISVRERRTEMAVLKVLGFAPWQVMVLILGEALLIGCGSGLLSAGGAFVLINWVAGGIKFPIAWFPAFKLAPQALWWGPMIGGLTAIAGSFLPACSARSVKVSEVFSKVS